MIDIEKRVKSLCREKGSSINKFAKEMGMNYSTLSCTIKGDPKISTVMEIARHFGMSLSEFMQEEQRWEPSFTFTLPDGKKVGLFPLVME